MIKLTCSLACRVLDDAGFRSKLRGIPEHHEGIDIDYLSKQIKRSENAAVEAGKPEPVGSARRLQASDVAH